jgi:hypothetical protein
MGLMEKGISMVGDDKKEIWLEINEFWGPPLTLELWYIWGDKFCKVVLGSRNFACGPNSQKY